MSFPDFNTTSPVSTTQTTSTTSTTSTSSKSKKAEKVDNFTHKIFSSSIFKQVMAFVSRVATSLGCEFIGKKIEKFLSGKKIGDFPADGVAKAAVKVVASAVENYVDTNFKAKPLPKGVYDLILKGFDSFVDAQRNAEGRKDKQYGKRV